ncbi:MAG: beta-galactosidase, partial [Oscillospiraceae bacterium]
MKNITFDQNGYYLDGKPIFLSSAELPYFRVPRKDWRFRLEKLKETGANCVCTYIPWAIYEPTDGKFVLEAGGPYDINAFLKLCAEMDLPVICRPGPYCYSELRYDGLPVWLCKNHPEIVAKDFHGEIFSATSVSYTHPYYLKRVKQWF